MTKKRSVVFNAITAQQFHRTFNLEGPGYLIAREAARAGEIGSAISCAELEEWVRESRWGGRG
ncbi:MAG TPA: hypothetical protein VE974_14850 [Thermoanaerobaculia bacterium]|nr:hypothetical protein [Thermoanaerobaculia bacterium]